jgi:type IV secretion system protein VirB10
MLNEGSFEETYDKKLDDFFERQKVSSLVYTDKKIVNYADVDEAALGQQYMASSDPNIAFQQSQANIAVISSTATTNEDLRFKIFQGKRFSAVLTHAISSELPGMIVAEIVRPVYGFQDKVILLPVGTRIIGQYSAASGSGTPVGASRIFTVWNRAIRPDGIEISLGATGSDRLGMAGQSGFVDNHFFEIFGVSSLVSILGAGASTFDSNQNYANPYTTGVVNSAAETSSSILENRINIKPTIYIDQGEAIEIVANNDLDFTQALSKYYDKQVVVQ